MSFFRDLFSKPVTSRDLKLKLHEVDRERRRSAIEMKKLSARRNDLIERMKKLRRDGNNVEVDYLYEDFKAINLELSALRREARVQNLEGISLKRYLRGIERLERSGDKDSVKKLIDRVRTSGLDAKLVASDLDDRAYLDELQATLDDAGLDSEMFEDEMVDNEKQAFFAQLDEINAAEEAGELDIAFERESQLRDTFDNEGGTKQSEQSAT